MLMDSYQTFCIYHNSFSFKVEFTEIFIYIFSIFNSLIGTDMTCIIFVLMCR